MKKTTLILLFIHSIVFGQNYMIDNTFNPSDPGIYQQNIGNGGTFLDNGKILTGNDFGGFNPCIYRLNNDGSIDSNFPKLLLTNYYIDDLFINKAQGNFITTDKFYSDNIVPQILRSYDSNGSLITSFTSPVFTKTDNSRGHAEKIAFLSNGKLLVFGAFNFVNGSSYNNIVRLNANGSIDTSFTIGTGFNSSPTSVAIQPDGKYVIGGEFSSYNGISKYRMIRLNSNGLIDNSFNVFTSLGQFGIISGYGAGPINDIVIQPDGKILTSGPSLYLNGSVTKRDIVRLNANGTTDTSFFMNYLTNSNYIEQILYASDGSIYFVNNGKTIKCNNSGQQVTFNDLNTVGYGLQADIVEQNNKILIAVPYKNALGYTRMGYHRLNSNGSLDLTFNPSFGPNSNYFDSYFKIQSCMLPDNKILIFGNNGDITSTIFTTYNDTPVKSIIRLTENGELDTGFNISPSIHTSMIASNNNFNKPIQTKKNYDGSIYLMGNFSGKYIVKLNYDGSLDNSFNFLHPIEGFSITDDNKIIAFGSSPIFKDGSRFKIVKFNADLTVDSSFNSLLFNTVPISIELVDNNKILVSFGDAVFNMKKLFRLNADGSMDNTFDFEDTDNVSRTKTINDKIYISVNDNSDSFLRRYHNNGSVDNSFTPVPTPNIRVYASLSNGRTVTVTNQINNPNYNNYERIHRINDSNGTQISTFAIPASANNFISQNCENLVVTGEFYEANNIPKCNIYRLSVPGNTVIPTPTAEINQLFSQGQTLADLIINGQNIQWYNAQNECVVNNSGKNSSQTSIFLPDTTLLVDGTTYYASQTINGIESNHRFPVTVHQILSVNESTMVNLKLYPNPVQNSLTLLNSVVIDKVEIYNLLGQKIMQKDFSSDKINLDFSNYNTGCYIVKIYSEGKIQTNKIVKE